MELQLLDMIQKLRTPFLDRVMVLLSAAGNAGIIWMALALVLLIIPRTRKCGIILSAALFTDLILCNGILKNLVRRVRPCDVQTAVKLLVARPRDYSFPSGHTAAAFAAVMGLYLSGMRKLWKPALVLACLMGFSRMYLYVHYPTDILAGILVGILSGYVGYRLAATVVKRAGRFVNL